ncbi:MAG: hypothetical protein ABIP63_10325, partial [Thermoanaerobaculia bacterium]
PLQLPAACSDRLRGRRFLGSSFFPGPSPGLVCVARLRAPVIGACGRVIKLRRGEGSSDQQQPACVSDIADGTWTNSQGFQSSFDIVGP